MAVLCDRDKFCLHLGKNYSLVMHILTIQNETDERTITFHGKL